MHCDTISTARGKVLPFSFKLVPNIHDSRIGCVLLTEWTKKYGDKESRKKGWGKAHPTATSLTAAATTNRRPWGKTVQRCGQPARLLCQLACKGFCSLCYLLESRNVLERELETMHHHPRRRDRGWLQPAFACIAELESTTLPLHDHVLPCRHKKC